eukprot:10478234-Ditylum_brightwellii.AAC.1
MSTSATTTEASIQKLLQQLKDTYNIEVNTDTIINHPQCDRTPIVIVKCANCNRRPIDNCTSLDYKLNLHP